MDRTERESLFKQCVTEMRPMLWRLSGGFAANADREDLLQEILMQVWVALPKFQSRSKLSTWVYRIGLFTAYNWSRKARSAPQRVPIEEAPATTVPDHSQAAGALDRVYAALRKMKELDRSVLLLVLEELPIAAVAEVLGISEPAAHTRLHRARKRLHELLQEEEQ